ncbi:MAG: hypothetical protein Q9162_001467 [Coniocarpon cinnabarinum]
MSSNPAPSNSQPRTTNDADVASPPDVPPQSSSSSPPSASPVHGTASASTPAPANTTSPRQPELNSTLDSEGRPARKRSMTDVGRASPQPRNDDNMEPQQRKSSAQNTSERRRKSSGGQNRRGQGTAGAANTRAPSANGPTQQKPQKTRMSKFLAMFNCCAAPSGDNTQMVDTEPTRKVDRPSQSTQSTPPQKSETGFKEAESSDNTKPQPSDDAGATSSYPKSPVTTSEKKVPEGGRTGVPSDTTRTSNVPGDVLAQPTEKSNMDKPLPASPQAEDVPKNGATAAAGAGAIGAAGVAGAGIAAANSRDPSKSDKPPAEGAEQVISDRTPQQAQTDEDIEMKDAPPSVPLAPHEVDAKKDLAAPTTAPQGETNPPTFPPPPPAPVPPTDGQFQSSQTRNTGASGPTEQSQEDRKWLLPPLRQEMRGKKCLVLDLDETLVHSSFKILHQADFTIPVEIEGQYHNVYVIKRPGVDQFMKRVGELYEVVVFTASVAKYGDPLLDQLDIHHTVHHRLFRESCYNHQGNYVKDLSQIGRDLRDTIIIDNSPSSYIFHPQHAVPISSWFSDAHDNELLDLIPVLEDLAGEQVQDVSLVLDVGL